MSQTMMRLLITISLVASNLAIFAAEADARGRLFRRTRARPVVFQRRGGGGNTSYNASLYAAHRIDPNTQAIAEMRAARMARENRYAHYQDGYGYGVGYAEGVGPGATPEIARSNCCDFTGVIVGQAVAQSASGTWYACTIYGN